MMDTVYSAILLVIALWFSVQATPNTTIVGVGLGSNAVDNSTLQTTTAEPEYCYPSMACGFLVYSPIEREPLSYVPGPCRCQDGYDCVRAYDKTSSTTIVYLCRNVTSVTTESPLVTTQDSAVLFTS